MSVSRFGQHMTNEARRQRYSSYSGLGLPSAKYKGMIGSGTYNVVTSEASDGLLRRVRRRRTSRAPRLTWNLLSFDGESLPTIATFEYLIQVSMMLLLL